jgi:hypothetical protein
MALPNLDALDLSDSDDGIFDTPAARTHMTKARNAGATAGHGAAGGKTRIKESHYTTEEAREAALRRELESIRSVNKAIEGVVDSLEKAKANMAVSRATSRTMLSLTPVRQSPKPCRMPPPCSRHGRASCHRRNTTSA